MSRVLAGSDCPELFCFAKTIRTCVSPTPSIHSIFKCSFCSAHCTLDMEIKMIWFVEAFRALPKKNQYATFVTSQARTDAILVCFSINQGCDENSTSESLFVVFVFYNGVM